MSTKTSARRHQGNATNPRNFAREPQRPNPIGDAKTLRVWSAARRARDARFDGRFYVAVRTTGIYCRPICPARTALERNVEYYPSAAAAAARGYFACLRCRPEAAAPLHSTPSCDAPRDALVSRALRLIEDGVLDPTPAEEAGAEERSAAGLAALLGVGERTLRRSFLDQLGATPAQIATTRRLHLARQLLLGSHLRCADVALAAGYGSARRFNAAVKRAFGLSPAQLRAKLRESEPTGATPVIHLTLGYRPPLAWNLLLDFLHRRAIPGIEAVDLDSATYQRWIRLDGLQGLITVRHDSSCHRLGVKLRWALDRAATSNAATPALPSLVPLMQRLRDLFDLAADPAVIERQLGCDELLGPSWQQAPGIRVPGCFDPFELTVRAVLGQQVTVRGATTLAERLVERYGRKALDPAWRIFPTPRELLDQDLELIGLPAARATCLRELARAFHEGSALLPHLETGTNLQRLQELPGIGPWTAQYVAMRALRDPDAFPEDDLVLRQHVGQKGSGKSPVLGARHLRDLAEAWRPVRAYAAMLLWQVPPRNAASS
jgi:AraC family transcriptional regulator of adaptative response / DNA-3-methyladenine glycosylase II